VARKEVKRRPLGATQERQTGKGRFRNLPVSYKKFIKNKKS